MVKRISSPIILGIGIVSLFFTGVISCGVSQERVDSQTTFNSEVGPSPWAIPKYPEARTENVSEVRFGVEVKDPYRWMENSSDADLTPWIEAQNQLVAERLNVPQKAKFKEEIRKLTDLDSFSSVQKRGGNYFFLKRAKGEDKAKLYTAVSLDDPKAILLVDPDRLGIDGNVSLASYIVTKKGDKLAVSLSVNGSDEEILRVFTVANRQWARDELSIKYSSIDWSLDGNVLFYTTDSTSKRPSEKSGRFFSHKLGTSQESDVLLFAPLENSHSLMSTLSDDGKKIFLSETEGWSDGDYSLIYLSEPAKKVQLISYGSGTPTFAGEEGDKFYFVTTRGASNGKLIEVSPDPTTGQMRESVIIPEQSFPMGAQVVNGKIFLKLVVDASSSLRVASLATPTVFSAVELPALGDFWFSSIFGEGKNRQVSLSFESYTVPKQLFLVDFVKGKPVLKKLLQSALKIDNVTVSQEFVTSKDGTKVPMFLVHRNDMSRDGRNPTILYGYGGFASSELPSWYYSYMLPWVQQGGVFAVANLRGGLEYGERWHQDGALLKKQNVFDDFIAAGEALISRKVTRSQQLGIYGISNGGLLVGAVLNQRPDLFGAAIPAVGVMDMLRFQLFSAGKFWVPEYGNSAEEVDFRNLLSYSPLHTIKNGSVYPSVMVETAIADERVVPMHSYKYVATLQRAQVGENPILLRVETKAGHGAGGGSYEKKLENNADVLTFFYRALVEKVAQ